MAEMADLELREGLLQPSRKTTIGHHAVVDIPASPSPPTAAGKSATAQS